MQYVLVVVAFSGGAAVAGIDYNSREACEAAAAAVVAASKAQTDAGWRFQPPQVSCSPKGVYDPARP